MRPPYIRDIARALRKRPTPAEKKLWSRLRNHQLGGLHFLRQHGFDRYIVDFYCYELKLVIELEGPIHEDAGQREYDEIRFAHLQALGLNILRLRNETVLGNIEDVLSQILAFRHSPPNPSLAREGGEPRSENVRIKQNGSDGRG